MKSNLELNSRSGIQCPVQASEEPYDKGKRKHLDAGSDKHGDCWIYTVLEYLIQGKVGASPRQLYYQYYFNNIRELPDISQSKPQEVRQYLEKTAGPNNKYARADVKE